MPRRRPEAQPVDRLAAILGMSSGALSGAASSPLAGWVPQRRSLVRLPALARPVLARPVLARPVLAPPVLATQVLAEPVSLASALVAPALASEVVVSASASEVVVSALASEVVVPAAFATAVSVPAALTPAWLAPVTFAPVTLAPESFAPGTAGPVGAFWGSAPCAESGSPPEGADNGRHRRPAPPKPAILTVPVALRGVRARPPPPGRPRDPRRAGARRRGARSACGVGAFVSQARVGRRSGTWPAGRSGRPQRSGGLRHDGNCRVASSHQRWCPGGPRCRASAPSGSRATASGVPGSRCGEGGWRVAAFCGPEPPQPRPRPH